MLPVKKRQEYLKELGFYNGDIDGITGEKTMAAYKALQERYFTRKKDIDGIYGKNTDILLQNAYNVKKYTKNFELEEFKCKCGGKHCTGYPVLLDIQFLKNLQAMRYRFGAITITSGLRCSKHNSNVGGVSSSRHKKGKAADIVCGISNTETGRKRMMEYWQDLLNYRYTYCNINGSNPGMGNAVHVDVK